MITIKNDGTIEPFGLRTTRESNFQIVAPTRDIAESSSEFDGEVDFGTKLRCGQWTIVAVTDDGLSVAQKMQARRTLAGQLNNLRNNGDYLNYESDSNKKIFVRLEGMEEVEEYPSWLKVSIPLKIGPLWVSVDENKAFKLESIPGGNYVRCEGMTYLKLTGTTRRVMDLELSGKSTWENNPGWPTLMELGGDDWAAIKRKAGNAYWTSTESDPYLAYVVDIFGITETMPKTISFPTRLCYTLPDNLYAVAGTGAEGSPYILSTLAVINSGTFETPVTIELKGPATNPEITIGGKILKYFGILTAGDTLTIDTGYKTVKFNNVNALANFEGKFPQIPPGKTIISYEGDGELTMKWHDRWL